jgi:hypothetical protein
MGTLTLIRPDGAVIELGRAEDQVYSFQEEDGTQYHWSVAEARKRAEANAVLGALSLEEAGVTPDLLRRMYPDLDEVYALTTDLSRPLLFVPLEGKHVLIDGWHRAFRGAVERVDLLPCYVLSQEDADACLIVKLPPGRGLPMDPGGEAEPLQREEVPQTPDDGRR